MGSGQGQGGYDPPSGKAPFHVPEISQFRRGSFMGTINNVIPTTTSCPTNFLVLLLRKVDSSIKTQTFPVSLTENPKFLFFPIETPTSCCPLREAWNLRQANPPPPLVKSHLLSFRNLAHYYWNINTSALNYMK